MLWVCHKWPLLCWDILAVEQLSKSFYHEWMLNFVKCFSCIFWDDHVIFILHFVNMVYNMDLQIMKQSCILRINHSLSHVWFFLHVVEFHLLTFCWSFLHLYSLAILACKKTFLFIVSLFGFGIKVMMTS